jgi:DNA-binding MarR family transcriptional regulator
MTAIVHPPEAMGMLLRETFRAMVERVEHQFDDMDLGLSQWLTLKLMGLGKIQCVGDINRELGLTTGASTRLVDQLEAKTFIIRQRSADDRRVVGVALTAEGTAMIEAMQPRLISLWNDQLAVFRAEERAMLFSLLSRLRDGLRGSAR